MFTTTTPWTDYFFVIVPILICYYAFVIFKFYRQPLLARFKQLPEYHSKNTTSQPNKLATEIIAEKTNEPQAEDTPEAPDPVLIDKTEELVSK